MGYYSSHEWKCLRDHVVHRDSYTCQSCGYDKNNKENRQLHAHHIIPRKEGGPDHPENLVTLCNHCHNKFEGKRINPKNNHPPYEEIINNLTENTLLSIVNKEIKNNNSYYHTLLLDNNIICNKCFNYEYSLDLDYPWIQSFNGNIKTTVKRIVHGVSIDFHKYPKIKQFEECKYCSYKKEDFIRPHKDHRSGMQDIQNIVSYLESSQINFSKDIIYESFKYLHKNSNKYKDNKCLKRSIQYAIDHPET